MTENGGKASERVPVTITGQGRDRSAQLAKHDFAQERIKGFQNEAVAQRDFQSAIRAFEFRMRHAIQTRDSGAVQEIVDNGLNPEKMRAAFNSSDLAGLSAELGRIKTEAEAELKKEQDGMKKNELILIIRSMDETAELLAKTKG